jgi:glycosyltransferase involved in cell wall biosynthesis
MPFLSIIIPTFNSSKTLEAAVNSVLQQTFIDFEILIIDGLSQDKTLEIAKEYNDERIKIWSEKDNGIYDAMNKGISKATGEWIYFLGSDDRLINNKVLDDVFGNRKAQEYDLIYGNVLWGESAELYYGKFDEFILSYTNICHQAIFYKRKILTQEGGFDLSYPALADWKLNIHCFLDPAIKTLYLPYLIAKFNINGSSKDFKDGFKSEIKQTYLSCSRNYPWIQRLRIKNFFERNMYGQLERFKLAALIKKLQPFNYNNY